MWNLFAFILGLLPLMLAMGAVGGMLVGTVFDIFVIPVLFIVFQSLQERIGGAPEKPLTQENKTGGAQTLMTR